MAVCHRPDLPEDFFGADAAFFVFVGADGAFTAASSTVLTGSGSAGASFG